MPLKHIMITGADGYLGYNLLRQLLSEDDCRLTLLLNARNNERAHLKTERLFQKLDSDLPQVRRERDIQLVFADLADYRLPDIAITQSINVVVHAAAVTRFDVSPEVAQAVNVDGTRRMLELARCSPKLEKFCLVSSLYASGLQSGTVLEQPLQGSSGFANHYERSKWAAEQLLRHDFRHLPWQICRVGLIASDNEDGVVNGVNAVHNTLKLFYYGLLSVLPGDPTIPLYMVTADYAATALRAAIETGDPHTYFNLAHDRSQTLTLDAFVDTAFAAFNEHQEFRRRNVLKPLFSDLDSFEILSEAMMTMGRGLIQSVAGSLRPFAKQLYVSKDVENRNAIALVPHYAAPDMIPVARKMCNFLIEKRWQKNYEPSTTTSSVSTR